jgi:hypothetical protein
MHDETTTHSLALACAHCDGSASRPEGGVLRCECGSLLARYVAGRLELKCRRCKRTLTVPAFDGSDERLRTTR